MENNCTSSIKWQSVVMHVHYINLHKLTFVIFPNYPGSCVVVVWDAILREIYIGKWIESKSFNVNDTHAHKL